VNQRGHILLLLLSIIVAMLVGITLLAGSSAVRIEGRAAADVRIQALTLARSAVDAGIRGEHTVSTEAGRATVRVVRVGDRATAEVELGGGTAVVTSHPPQERWYPAF